MLQWECMVAAHIAVEGIVGIEEFQHSWEREMVPSSLWHFSFDTASFLHSSICL